MIALLTLKLTKCFEDEEAPFRLFSFLCFRMERCQSITGSPAIAVRHQTILTPSHCPSDPQILVLSTLCNETPRTFRGSLSSDVLWYLYFAPQDSSVTKSSHQLRNKFRWRTKDGDHSAPRWSGEQCPHHFRK